MDAVPAPTKDERTLGLWAHVSTFAGYVVPFGNVIAPLVIWQIKKDDSAFVAEHAKEALNFQISMTIYMLVCIPLVFVIIGIFLMIALAIADLILVIMAAIKANEGGAYRYPFCLRLIN